MIARLAIAALLSGCALAADGIYKLGGRHGAGRYVAGGHATGEAEQWREIEIDPRTGLVCRDVERPYVRAPVVRRASEHPNGYKALMQVFTAVEGASVGTAIAVAEHRCSKPEGCSVSRTSFYLALAPFVVDLLYGTYRSFTIHDEIVRSTDVSWLHASSTPALTEHAGCAPGTELVLHDRGDQLVVHIGDDGVTLAAELELIAHFLAKHPTFAIAGPNVRLDATHARSLVAHVLPPASTVVTTTHAPPVVAPPAGATIEVETPIGSGCISVGTRTSAPSSDCSTRSPRK